jgi:glycerol kinase
VLVFNGCRAVCGRVGAEFPQYYPRPGWVEHDPAELWSVTLEVVTRALQQAKANPGEVKGIGITNQRETALLWDRRTGLPVARAIVWQDRRTARLCDELKQEGLEPGWQQKTGLLIDPYFSATKVHWLLDQSAGLRSRAFNGEIAFGTIDTWLVWKLTGGRCHVTDYSNASRTLLYNIHNSTGMTIFWAGSISPEPFCRESDLHPMSMARRIPRSFSATGCPSPASPEISRPRCSARPATARGWPRRPMVPALFC